MDRMALICAQFYELNQIPMALADSSGHYLHSFPEILTGIVREDIVSLVLKDFELQSGDISHPLISYIEGGLFSAVAMISPDLYLLIGPVSPVRFSRQEIDVLGINAIVPEYLNEFAGLITKTPLVSLNLLKTYISLIMRSLCAFEISTDAVIVSDIAGKVPYSEEKFEKERFRQRESVDQHAVSAYENGICDAVALGKTGLLLQAFSAPTGGSIGRMTSDNLRQSRYSFISFATLVSRAAIRGGIDEETAFLLSDLYCQRMDILSEQEAIERLLVDMAMDFTEKVSRNRIPQNVSPVVQKALRYITVHLHDPFGMEDLSETCNLCSRSLSIRFRKEMGISVSDYIHKEKTEEAKFLLKNTDTPLSKIAFYLNYSSQSHFTQMFRKYTDETPERYRTRRRAR